MMASGTAPQTIESLRAGIAALPKEHQWTVNPDFADADLQKVRKTGADHSKTPLAKDVKPVDFKALLGNDTDNKTLLTPKAVIFPGTDEVKGLKPVPAQREVGAAQEPMIAGTSLPSSVDWRSFEGGGWLQPVVDQNGDESCWMFAATALVETTK
jgi:hypothetical protein